MHFLQNTNNNIENWFLVFGKLPNKTSSKSDLQKIIDVKSFQVYIDKMVHQLLKMPIPKNCCSRSERRTGGISKRYEGRA